MKFKNFMRNCLKHFGYEVEEEAVEAYFGSLPAPLLRELYATISENLSHKGGSCKGSEEVEEVAPEFPEGGKEGEGVQEPPSSTEKLSTGCFVMVPMNMQLPLMPFGCAPGFYLYSS
jgi:hypothetical protein